MIALRAPVLVPVAIATAALAATAAAAGLFAAHRCAPPASMSEMLPTVTAVEPLEMRWRTSAPACDPDGITAIVIRGQFTATEPQSFAISFGAAQGYYTAITDARGYFEVRIPREDFDGDLCQLPLSSKDFSDEQMTLRYRIDFER